MTALRSNLAQSLSLRKIAALSFSVSGQTIRRVVCCVSVRMRTRHGGLAHASENPVI